MIIGKVEELVQIIDNLKEKEKKAIVKYVWIKYILGLTESYDRDNSIIRKFEEMEEKNKSTLIKKIYM